MSCLSKAQALEKEIIALHKNLKGYTKEDAMLVYLDYVAKHPLSGGTFFGIEIKTAQENLKRASNLVVTPDGLCLANHLGEEVYQTIAWGQLEVGFGTKMVEVVRGQTVGNNELAPPNTCSSPATTSMIVGSHQIIATRRARFFAKRQQSWATRLPTKRGKKPKVALMLVQNQYVGESRKIVMETWLAETIVGLVNDYVAIKVAANKREGVELTSSMGSGRTVSK